MITQRQKGFTLIEVLVVVAIIALLIAILLPSLKNARQQARNIVCQSNLKSHGQAFLIYAIDHKGQLPFFSEGVPGDSNSPNYTTLQDPRESGGRLWYELLVNQKSAYKGYEAGIAHHNDPREGVWRCPVTPDEQMLDVHGNSPTWGGGYGVAINVIGYQQGASEFSDGSPKLSSIKRTAELMLIGDTGRPNVYTMPDIPFQYVTWMKSLNPPFNWTNPKGDQVAARHSDHKANITFFDGHVSPVHYDRIQENYRDMFGMKDPNITKTAMR